jgi:hypothetical protein
MVMEISIEIVFVFTLKFELCLSDTSFALFYTSISGMIALHAFLFSLQMKSNNYQGIKHAFSRF